MNMQTTNSIIIKFLLSLALISLLAGCSKTSSSGAGDGSGLGLSDEDLALQNSERWGEGNIPRAAEDGVFPDIHFAYDSYVVEPEYHDILKQNAEVLVKNSNIRAEIEGHCDSRGTNEYNLVLGEKRAKAVASFLASFGVPANQLTTISYGEEIPLEPAQTEEAYVKNRRAHFAIYKTNQ